MAQQIKASWCSKKIHIIFIPQAGIISVSCWLSAAEAESNILFLFCDYSGTK